MEEAALATAEALKLVKLKQLKKSAVSPSSEGFGDSACR